jgi:pSer/pThr/pTyr-binding forkhead associated (FHA) protein
MKKIYVLRSAPSMDNSGCIPMWGLAMTGIVLCKGFDYLYPAISLTHGLFPCNFQGLMKELPVIIVQLVHIQGPLKGQIQEFTAPEIAIGRHPSCQVLFPAELTIISRKHAELVREGNRYKLIDRSANGTFINGKKITEAFLKDGDVIMFTEGGPKVSYLAKITDEVQVEQAGQPQAPSPKPAPEAVVHAPETPQPQVAKPVTAPPQAPKPSLIQPKAARHAPDPPAPPKSILQSQPSPPVASAPEPPKPSEQPRQAIQKVQAPLMVQLGPTLRSFKELPIVMGKKPGCDFVLNHPAIAETHAQIFYSANQYWVRDLTGRSLISINGRPVGFEAALKPQDILSLAPGGPALRFMGEGRLAEYEEANAEEAPKPTKPARPEPAKKPKASKSIFDIFKK